MLSENDILCILNDKNVDELVCIVNDIKEKSWNGFTRKEDLIAHIINHYRFYCNMRFEIRLSLKVRMKCHCDVKRIQNIVSLHK